MTTTFDFSDNFGDMHQAGDTACDVGWCDDKHDEFPHPCEMADCPGLVHANFGDENWDGDVWLNTMCDVCGEAD